MITLISQIFGIIITVGSVLMLQLKDVKKTLFCSAVVNILGTINYIIAGGLSGCGVYLIAAVQSSVFLIIRTREREPSKYLGWFFSAAMLICSLTAYRRPADLFAAAAALFCALGLAQKKASGFRFFTLFNGASWLVYDVVIGAYSMILAHSVTLLAAAVGIVRLDLKKTKKEVEK